MSLKIANTQLTTVGAGTISAAGILGQFVTRSGPTSAFTDTTDTAANITAAMRGLYNAGTSSDSITWFFDYVNTTAYTATIAAGANVTLTSQAPTPSSGTLTVATNSVATFLVSATPSAGTVALTLMYRNATE